MIGDLNEKEIANALIDAAMPGQNCGGCGYFAKEVYNLFLYLGYDPTIIVSIDPDVGDQDDYLEQLKLVMMDDCDEVDLVPQHVVVQVQGINFDADGTDVNTFIFSEDEHILVDVSIQQLEFLLELPHWNFMYDAQACNPQLRENFTELREVLSKLSKFRAAEAA